MTDIILHHYDQSPFGRKVRAVLGAKQLSWRSCDVAMKPPRPALAMLAGGYRRIPVLQIGADIFCDSNLIVRVLDSRAGGCVLRPAGDVLSTPVSQWFEPRLFAHFSPLRFRTPEDLVGSFSTDAERKEFSRDRLGFMAPMLDLRKSAENVATCAAHVRVFARWVEDLLADGRAYLQGEAPTHADFSAFHPLHWLRDKSAHRDFLAEFSRLWGWVGRIDALGEGTRTEVTDAEALETARGTEPSFSLPAAPSPSDPPTGTRVRVAPTDYGIDPSEGTLVSIGSDHISITRERPETGRLAQHFPRWGYRIDAL